MPTLKRAGSRKRPATLRRTRIAQMCSRFSGRFCPQILPLFHGCSAILQLDWSMTSVTTTGP